jgi:PTH1 family peptidyl-tRNA hydrolase
LGNPGRKYTDTRHNIGFRVIEEFAGELTIPLDRLKHQAQLGEGLCGAAHVILAKPMTFMNLSGNAIGEIVAYKNIEPEHVIIVHDEVDFLFGTLRVKTGGGAGGHKGIKSIIERLGTPDFIRIRIGVGRPDEISLTDHVLSGFNREEKNRLEEVISEAVYTLKSILDVGVDKTRNRLHNKERLIP